MRASVRLAEEQRLPLRAADLLRQVGEVLLAPRDRLWQLPIARQGDTLREARVSREAIFFASSAGRVGRSGRELTRAAARPRSEPATVNQTVANFFDGTVSL